MVVPAGALSTNIEIRVSPVSGVAELPSGFAMAGAPLAFTPHGTTFATPVRVELPHDGSATGAMRLDDESDTTWEPIDVAVVEGTRLLLDVEHFSVLVAVRSMGLERDASVGERDGGFFGESDGGALADSGSGGVDAGPTAIDAGGGTCDPPLAGAPTGTATVTGTAHAVVDAVARVVHMSDISTLSGGSFAYRNDLVIDLTDYAEACGVFEAGTRVRGASWLRITLAEYSNTARPGLPSTGTYTWMTRPPYPEDELLLLSMSEFTDVSRMDCEGATSIGGFGDPTGSVTLTSVTASRVDGTFTWMGPGGSASFSGSFSAPICGTTDVNPTYCCR